MNALLKLEDLAMNFGGVRALDKVSYDAGQGMITAMIGPNGAGKTTAINCMSGVTRPQSGRVYFHGIDITGMPAHRLAGMGLTRTFQNLQVFSQLSVLENVMVGMHSQLGSGFLVSMLRLPLMRRQEKAIRERSLETLEWLGMAHLAGQKAGQLSYGDRKRLELARALVGRPQMVLLDEPVAGLNPAETDRMGELLLQVKQSGVSLLLVEHDMGLVMRVSDQVVVLHFGRKIAQGTPHEIQQHHEVIQIYLGGAGKELGPIA